MRNLIKFLMRNSCLRHIKHMILVLNCLKKETIIKQRKLLININIIVHCSQAEMIRILIEKIRKKTEGSYTVCGEVIQIMKRTLTGIYYLELLKSGILYRLSYKLTFVKYTKKQSRKLNIEVEYGQK